MSKLIFNQIDTTPVSQPAGATMLYAKADGSLYMKSGSSAEVLLATTSLWVSGNGAGNINYTGGNVGIGTTAPGATLTVAGSVSARAATYQHEVLGISVSDETSDIATGTPITTFRMPYAMTLTEVRANVNTAPVGSTIIVDINEGGSTILSTKLTIDASEKTSTTAAAPAVISDAALADDAEITIDIDQVGSSTAGKGLKIWLIGRRA